jgi:hypothetical protein
MTDVKPSSKPQDCYLKNVSTATVVPTNGSWLKGSDKRADAARPRGDAFEGSEQKPTDARQK